MNPISRIIEEDKRLVDNLRNTAKQYIELKKDRAQTAVDLFNSFLKDYVFQLDSDKQKAAQNLKYFFKKDKLKVVAIDGTKYLESRRGCLVFYVLASPLLYELDLNSADPRPLRIDEPTVRNNVMVLVPVPLSEIFLIREEHLEHEVTTEEERAEVKEVEIGDIFQPERIGKIDVALMKLAEVYTAYWSITNLNPDVIMTDGSLFQWYSFTNRSTWRLNLYRGEVLGQRTTKNDFDVFKSIPISSELEIPSYIFIREFITAELLRFKTIKLKKTNGKLSFHSRLADKEVSITYRQLSNLQEWGYFDIAKDDIVELKLKPDYHESWERLKKLFLKVCEEGFGKNNLDAFRIYFNEDGKTSYRYMCEEDIETLCRIGYNLIIEECWKSGTLLFSITKDSFVRFFVDNFLTIGGPRHLKKFNLNQNLLPRVPSTDAGMIFDISVQVSDLHAPIALMEYDPAISTVYSTLDENGNYIVNQLAKVAQERQFLRSLVQISESKLTGRKSYVYTVDRITYPKLDTDFDILNVKVGNSEYRFAYYEKPSEILKTIIDILLLISSNRHDAVFGYPDPLFDADQYVKTLGRTHMETLDLALTEIDLDEFSVTYRQRREMGGG